MSSPKTNTRKAKQSTEDNAPHKRTKTDHKLAILIHTNGRVEVVGPFDGDKTIVAALGDISIQGLETSKKKKAVFYMDGDGRFADATPNPVAMLAYDEMGGTLPLYGLIGPILVVLRKDDADNLVTLLQDHRNTGGGLGLPAENKDALTEEAQRLFDDIWQGVRQGKVAVKADYHALTDIVPVIAPGDTTKKNALVGLEHKIAMAYSTGFKFVLRKALASGKMVVIPGEEDGPPQVVCSYEATFWQLEGRQGHTRVYFDRADKTLHFGSAEVPLWD